LRNYLRPEALEWAVGSEADFFSKDILSGSEADVRHRSRCGN